MCPRMYDGSMVIGLLVVFDTCISIVGGPLGFALSMLSVSAAVIANCRCAAGIFSDVTCTVVPWHTV